MRMLAAWLDWKLEWNAELTPAPTGAGERGATAGRAVTGRSVGLGATARAAGTTTGILGTDFRLSNIDSSTRKSTSSTRPVAGAAVLPATDESPRRHHSLRPSRSPRRSHHVTTMAASSSVSNAIAASVRTRSWRAWFSCSRSSPSVRSLPATRPRRLLTSVSSACTRCRSRSTSCGWALIERQSAAASARTCSLVEGAPASPADGRRLGSRSGSRSSMSSLRREVARTAPALRCRCAWTSERSDFAAAAPRAVGSPASSLRRARGNRACVRAWREVAVAAAAGAGGTDCAAARATGAAAAGPTEGSVAAATGSSPGSSDNST